MKNNSIVIAIVVALAVGAAGFFAGTKYQQSKTPAFTRQFGGGQGGANRQGFRPVTGEIVKSDDTSITVKLSDGSTKIVILPSSAIYNKTTSATKSDFTVGQRVSVFGTNNADGSVTAQSVQLGSMFGASGSGRPRQ